jgi:hypothetical protein
VADVARVCAEEWLQLAEELEQRNALAAGPAERKALPGVTRTGPDEG